MGLRSEKEIEEADFCKYINFDDVYFGEDSLKEWLIEGEHRYSVEELEKVLMWVLSEKNKIPLGHTPHLVNQYVLRTTVSALELLKNNPEKVKEILGGN